MKKIAQDRHDLQSNAFPCFALWLFPPLKRGLAWPSLAMMVELALYLVHKHLLRLLLQQISFFLKHGKGVVLPIPKAFGITVLGDMVHNPEVISLATSYVRLRVEGGWVPHPLLSIVKGKGCLTPNISHNNKKSLS